MFGLLFNNEWYVDFIRRERGKILHTILPLNRIDKCDTMRLPEVRSVFVGQESCFMKIGAYQFPVTGEPEKNFYHIREGIEHAHRLGVKLLAFPECAVTGYPPLDIPSSASVNMGQMEWVCRQIQSLSAQYSMHIIAGAVTKRGNGFYNSALVFAPDRTMSAYDKRALWGWDRENFSGGKDKGVFCVDSLKIGVRICFEVRFPEYFRELYREKTDLNIILFYDVNESESRERYQIMKGHIQTRAAENVCPVLTVNTAYAFQAVPTALFGTSGRALSEAEPGQECLLSYDFEPGALNFSEKGRKDISDMLLEC